MHIPTHILSGWCAAAPFRLSPRERLLCMVAATVPDVDGLGVIAGGTQGDAYQTYHHVFGHNVFFVMLVAAACAAASRRWALMFFLTLALGHLHLLMDLFGSGPGWGIPYFWPVERTVWSTAHGWAFFSWQNITAAAVLLGLTILIVRFQRRTPLEAVMPDLDRQLVAMIGGRSV